MNKDFEESFFDLIRQIEPLIEIEDTTSAKWIIVSESQSQLQEVKNIKGAMSRALQMAILKVRESEAFKSCNRIFHSLELFEDAIERAGYWGTFQSNLHFSLMKSTTSTKRRPKIDPSAALSHLMALGNLLQTDVHSFEMSAWIHGIRLASKVLEFPSGIRLYRLNRKEMNERSPFVEPYLSSISPFHIHSPSSTEIRTSFDLSFSDTEDASLFELENMARMKASDQFQTVVDALHLTQPGWFVLGNIQMSSTLPVSTGQRVTPMDRQPFKTIQIKKADVPILSHFASIRSESDGSDPILMQSMNRFLLGKNRRKHVDQVIDFVIAFEVLLLTSNKSAIKQEFAYRFAINAATISKAAIRNSARVETHQRFLTAYKVRSHILHGRPQEDLVRVLHKGQFNNVGTLAKYLEERYRAIVAWLCSFDPDNRPYIKTDGWRELLWN